MTNQALPATPVADTDNRDHFLEALLKAEQDARVTQWDGKGGQQGKDKTPIDPWAINHYR